MRWLKLWRGWLPILLFLIAFGLSRSASTTSLFIAMSAWIALVISLLVFIYSEWRSATRPLREARRIIRETAPPRCAVCGYDLRASKDRCPECGTSIPNNPLPLTPMVERAIERANAIARELNDDHVGTQHLLLALITEPQSVAAGMYADLGIGESEFRDQLAGMNVAPQSVD